MYGMRFPILVWVLSTICRTQAEEQSARMLSIAIIPPETVSLKLEGVGKEAERYYRRAVTQ